MAGRLFLFRASHRLRATLLSSSLLEDAHRAVPFVHFIQQKLVSYSGEALFANRFKPNDMFGARKMTSSNFPQILDPDVKIALNRLFAISWLEIDDTTRESVESAFAKASEDKAGWEILLNSWRAAQAVEKFSNMLNSLKMELDDLSGGAGETVRKLPEDIYQALQAAFQRYTTYLSSFEQDEIFLKKKVEAELGSVLILIKQRCSGLDAEWGEITLLGTTGLSGSYIERRQ